MIAAWLDTNIVVRFLTKEPPAMAQRAARLLARAQAGEIALRLTPITVAEIVWVLTRVYRREPGEIATGMNALLRADGIHADQRDALLEALDLMVEKRVSFPDAFVAISARQADEPVCSFDTDFKRLNVAVIAG